MKKLTFGAAIAAAVILASCVSIGLPGGTADPSLCPYAAGAPEISCGAKDGLCQIACASVEVFNRSEVPVIRMEFAFRILDGEGEEVTFGMARTEVQAFVEAEGQGEILIPLDDYLFSGADKELFLDGFFASRIEYADGSVWKDEWGLFAQ